MKRITYYHHALEKFELLEKHGVQFTQQQIEKILKNPDKILPGNQPNRKVAQGVVSDSHLLRIIYEEYTDYLEVVTFYPARRSRYEH